MPNGISRDIFEKASDSDKLLYLYDEIQIIKKGKWKKTLAQLFGSFAGGFVGICALGKLTLFK